MDFLANLDTATIVALVTSITTLVGLILGIIEKIKAGNYKAALDDGKVVAKDLMETIDEFKEIVSPDVREPIMKGLGKKLEIAGLKEEVDKTLNQIGLNNKS